MGFCPLCVNKCHSAKAAARLSSTACKFDVKHLYRGRAELPTQTPPSLSPTSAINLRSGSSIATLVDGSKHPVTGQASTLLTMRAICALPKVHSPVLIQRCQQYKVRPRFATVRLPKTEQAHHSGRGDASCSQSHE